MSSIKNTIKHSVIGGITFLFTIGIGLIAYGTLTNLPAKVGTGSGLTYSSWNSMVDSLTELETKINGVSSTPSGAIMSFAMNTCPNGWLKANGIAISRTTYSSLFGSIGTTYGVGDGSTTFNLPDLRGEFVRGWDDSRGIDSGRTFGSWQIDTFKAHDHGYIRPNTNGCMTVGSCVTGAYGNINTTTDSIGGTETRPRNIALLYCIKQ